MPGLLQGNRLIWPGGCGRLFLPLGVEEVKMFRQFFQDLIAGSLLS